MGNLLELKSVNKNYKLGKTTIRALRGVNLSLKPGKFYAIKGPSGCGKSTLLHIMGAMDLPSSGHVSFMGKKITNSGQRELTVIRADKIGFIFQAFHLNPILNAADNIAISLRLGGMGRKPALKKAKAYLDIVGLADRGGHYPSELSGGERQRVAIARALVKSPAIVFADEPTGNLDSVNGKSVMALLKDLQKKENTTLVLVTHNNTIAEQADEILEMKDGIITGAQNA